MNRRVIALKHKEQGYWFTSKRYGYGWGGPIAWQGWVVLLLHMLFTAASTGWFIWEINKEAPDDREGIPGAVWVYLGLHVVAAAILIGVIRRHGPPARWRWGDEEDSSTNSGA